MIIQSDNLEQFQKIASNFAVKLKGGEVVGLIGELGLGKTTFIQFLAVAMGVKEKVLSPTFVLLKIYRASHRQSSIKQLVHVDAYRLNHAEELKNIGLPEYLNRPDTVTVIEWADQVKDILPPDIVMINIAQGKEEGQRVIKISRPA